MEMIVGLRRESSCGERESKSVAKSNRREGGSHDWVRTEERKGLGKMKKGGFGFKSNELLRSILIFRFFSKTWSGQ